MSASRLLSEEKPGPESLWYRTSTSNPSFPSLTKSLSSLNVKSVNALLKILYLCTKPSQMKGWRALKRKASQLSELIEYSKKAFCRQLLNFVNGLALATLFVFFPCMNIQAFSFLFSPFFCNGNACGKLILMWKHRHQQVMTFSLTFEVCFSQEHNVLCLCCQGT